MTDSVSKRMENVPTGIVRLTTGVGPECIQVTNWPWWDEAVEVVPVPGGLDAAVNRLAGFMSATEPYKGFHPENLKGHALRALEAAFTATSEVGNG